MTATIVVAAAAPATDTQAVDPTVPGDTASGWGLLALAALGGLIVGRRRFAHRVADATIGESRAATDRSSATSGGATWGWQLRSRPP